MRTQLIRKFSNFSNKQRDIIYTLCAKSTIKRGQLEAIRIEYRQYVDFKFKTIKARENQFIKLYESDDRVISIKRDLELYRASIRDASNLYWRHRKVLTELLGFKRHSMSRHFKVTFGNDEASKRVYSDFLTKSIYAGNAMRFGWV